jgi:hypothetical protein
MLLIIGIDRPWNTMIKDSLQAMIELKGSMGKAKQ